MSLRLRVALYLAIFAGLLTIILSGIYGVRILNILYRGTITLALFGVIGYIIGGVVESHLQKLIANDAHIGKRIDITDEPDLDINSFEKNLSDTTAADSEFEPLTPGDFMSFSTTQK